MTDLDRMRRAMLLDPYDLLAQHAYRDAWLDAGHEDEPRIITHWVCSLDAFLAEAWETFSQHPVIEVALMDVEPQTYEGGPGTARFYLTRVKRGDYKNFTDHWIPEEFASAPWRRVCSKLLHRSERSFSDVPSALADLSDACIWYGRCLVGLPALQPQPV